MGAAERCPSLVVVRRWSGLTTTVILVACAGGTPGGPTAPPRLPPAPSSVPASPSTSIPAAAAPSRAVAMYVTSYGYDDNSPPSTQIAYPVIHSQATEGAGTYDDPTTFATDRTELAPGTLIYVPHLRKYFVMEDDCAECDTDWEQQRKYHVDLWQGPQQASPQPALSDCEAMVTRESAPVVVNPPSTLAVDRTPLFVNGRCTAHVY
jgi:hypothetical protein